MNKYTDMFPPSRAEEDYLEYLRAPGESVNNYLKIVRHHEKVGKALHDTDNDLIKRRHKKVRDRMSGDPKHKEEPDFDREQLHLGVKTEMEHTSDYNKAKKIALDHLRENPNYYTKLKQCMPDAVHKASWGELGTRTKITPSAPPAVHTHIVHGPLAPNGKTFAGAKRARAYAEKLDQQYGGSRHSVSAIQKSDDGPTLVIKALPKKAKDDSVKRRDAGKASQKVAGKTGKTRYSYPQEKKSGVLPPETAGDKEAQAQRPDLSQQDPVPAAGNVQAQPKTVDPSELANQLGLSLSTLQTVYRKFLTNKKLHGREGFVTFMGKHLSGVASKHGLDKDYFGMLYDALASSSGPAAGN